MFAAQVSAESDYCIFIRYVFPMLGNIFVFQVSVLAAQVLVESDCGIYMRYEL